MTEFDTYASFSVAELAGITSVNEATALLESFSCSTSAEIPGMCYNAKHYFLFHGTLQNSYSKT
jgi:hypothetical protein